MLQLAAMIAAMIILYLSLLIHRYSIIIAAIIAANCSTTASLLIHRYIARYSIVVIYG